MPTSQEYNDWRQLKPAIDDINEYLKNFIVAGGSLMMGNRFAIYCSFSGTCIRLHRCAER